jgi:hypothetical protein
LGKSLKVCECFNVDFFQAMTLIYGYALSGQARAGGRPALLVGKRAFQYKPRGPSPEIGIRKTNLNFQHLMSGILWLNHALALFQAKTLSLARNFGLRSRQSIA